MSCPDLIAEVEDVRVRIAREVLDPSEVAQLEALLADASSMVRSITGRPFGTATYTLRMTVGIDGRIRLPQRDISAVSSVKTTAGVEIGGTWDGLHWLSVGTLNVFDSDASCADVVDVTLTRTGPPAKPWVKALVVQMAARAFGRPADQSGTTQETIASYSYTVGAAAASGGIGLTAQEEARLRTAFPKGGSTARLGLRG